MKKIISACFLAYMFHMLSAGEGLALQPKVATPTTVLVKSGAPSLQELCMRSAAAYRSDMQVYSFDGYNESATLAECERIWILIKSPRPFPYISAHKAIQAARSMHATIRRDFHEKCMSLHYDRKSRNETLQLLRKPLNTYTQRDCRFLMQQAQSVPASLVDAENHLTLLLTSQQQARTHFDALISGECQPIIRASYTEQRDHLLSAAQEAITRNELQITELRELLEMFDQQAPSSVAEKLTQLQQHESAKQRKIATELAHKRQAVTQMHMKNYCRTVTIPTVLLCLLRAPYMYALDGPYGYKATAWAIPYFFCLFKLLQRRSSPNNVINFKHFSCIYVSALIEFIILPYFSQM